MVQAFVPLQLSIVDTADLLRGRIRVGLKNISGNVVRLPDVIDDRTSDFFFYTSLQAGRTYRLNSRVGKITFSQELSTSAYSGWSGSGMERATIRRICSR